MNYGILIIWLACGATAIIASNVRYRMRHPGNIRRGSVLSGPGQPLTWIERRR
jgi:hypothetical protein